MIRLFELNRDLEDNTKDFPYSNEHRQKLRVWQSLLVLVQLLDPSVYTPAFRQNRLQISKVDIVSWVTQELFRTIKKSHIPSIR